MPAGLAFNPFVPARRRGASLAQQLVERLREQIRSGAIPAGAKLPSEAQIIASEGVSRTVVREALSRLSAAGLTETLHGVGTFVRPATTPADFRLDPAALTTLVEVRALLELRLALETEAAALAAHRREPGGLEAMRSALTGFSAAIAVGSGTVEHDYRFHLGVALATGNRYFADLMRALGTLMIPRTRLPTAELAQLDRSEYLAGVHREHQEIYAAIERGDADAARAAMRTHLSNSRERLQQAHEVAAGSTNHRT
ncbi:MAG: FadR family transcriptional regulator [Burkholderiales bacterium]|nr:FadR family transcriptional regulator [Burkholderiales bacterium]